MTDAPDSGSSPTDPTRTPGSLDPIEKVLGQCLDRPEDEWASALDAACIEHPDLAEDLRRRFGLIAPATTAATDPTRLGEFALGERLGSGGMGVVYAAHDTQLDRDVAVKTVRPENLWFDGARERFAREVTAAARLQHPGIVPIFSVGEQDGVPYYAMERVDGIGLDELIGSLGNRSPEQLSGIDVDRCLAQRIGRAPLDQDAAKVRYGSTWTEACLRIGHMAADALEHAHGHGVLHRDVKPSNLMLRDDGRVQLVDFGLARKTGEVRMTRTGVPVGSLLYMAPEQLADRETDARTDVYALGVTLCELMTLRSPFQQPSEDSVRSAIRTGTFEAPQRIVRGLPWEAATIVTVAMDVDPARRFQSAAALRDDLARASAGEPIHARRPGTLLRTWRWVQRHPTRTTALASAVLLLGGTPTALYVQQAAANRELQHTLDQVDRLGDELEAGRLTSEVGAQHTGSPTAVASARDWLARATPLVDRLEGHRQALAEVRSRALPRTEADATEEAALDRDFEVRIERLKATKPALAKLHSASLRERLVSAEQRQQDLLERQRDETSFYRFEQVRDAWLHTSLAKVVRDVESLAAKAETLRLLLSESDAITQRTTIDAASAWETAAASLSTDARFAGVHLEPIPGLLPLGPDPRSKLQEFAVLATGTAPLRAEDGALEFTFDSAVVLALVPGGKFFLGASRGSDSPQQDPNALDAEGPPTEIALAPFFIAKHETSQAQWMHVMRTNPSSIPAGMKVRSNTIDERHPITGVSWGDARDFATRTGTTLPTEAQWEYAARATTTTPYWTGDQPESINGALNCCDQTVVDAGLKVQLFEASIKDGWIQTAPVGSFRDNAFGLFDTMGNVSEWTLDNWCGYDTKARAGDGLRTSQDRNRTTRGGHWASHRLTLRSASRAIVDPDTRDVVTGFRVVRPLAP